MLQGAGYEVIGEATNGQEAVDLANLHKPDLCNFRCQDAVMDGISAAEK